MKSLNFKLFCLEKIKNINFQRTGYLTRKNEKWGFASALPKYVSKDYPFKTNNKVWITRNLQDFNNFNPRTILKRPSISMKNKTELM